MATDLTINQVVSQLQTAMEKKERRGRKFHILFLGASGAGKTSWLNLIGQFCAMYDCGLDQLPTDFKLYNDEKLERDQGNPMVSKTSSTKSYDIKIGGVTLMITDTPGLGVDSGGIGKEKENVRNIVDYIKTVDYVDCICLVINGRTPRSIPAVKYAVSEISAILPNEAHHNIIICATNCLTVAQSTIDLKILGEFFKHGIVKDNVFYFENPLCILENARRLEKMDATIAEDAKYAYEKACKMFQKILLRIQAFDTIPTTAFMKVYIAKQAVEREILAVTVQEYNQKQLDELKKQYSSYAVKLSKVIVTEDKHYNTLCDHPGCYSNCHLNCGLPHSFDTDVFKNCACMAGSSQVNVCVKCNHSYVTHYHQYVRFDRQEVHAPCDVIAAHLKKDSTQALQNLSVRIQEFMSVSSAKDFHQVLDTQVEVVKEYQGAYGITDQLKSAEERINSAKKVADKVLPKRT